MSTSAQSVSSTGGVLPDIQPSASMHPLVSHPVMYSTGPFAGRTILVRLVGVQQPDRGRKWSTARCGNIDVRPIDPPPIVRLQIFEVFNIGSPRQRVVELGQTTYVLNPSHLHITLSHPHVVAYVRGVPVFERSKRTADLVGNTFSPSTCSKGQLIFAFTNLAVREEGIFFLRYRTFNTVYSAMGNTPMPVLAECVGGAFKIYPTNGFPGLSPSTALTKARLISSSTHSAPLLGITPAS
ncbi:velvet factor-domain-containing protein [Fomitopsis betulina]|nr:velvet factor-domain-containing protein [Fomitopsis betulina]